MSKIQNYLLSHPIDRSKKNPYDDAAKALKVDKEVVRSCWRRLRNQGKVESSITILNPEYQFTPEGDVAFSNYKDDIATIKKDSTKEVKNELDLAEECDIDL